jgi:hypothetical protein
MLPINAQPEPKIYTIRGVQVMLDRDLAFFYGVKSIRLREQIKRNPNRFPSDFVFQLSQSETDILVSQNAIPSIKSLGGSNPHVLRSVFASQFYVVSFRNTARWLEAIA